jgi:Cdc6-like AAA superfamily ATPase
MFLNDNNEMEKPMDSITCPKALDLDFNVDQTEPTAYVKGLYRVGDFGHFCYKSFNMNIFCKIHPLQQTVVDSIYQIYMRSQKSCVKILLHGKTGCGKTSIAKFLALQLNSVYIETFNPLDPGDEFMILYEDHCKNNKETPLIVVINEYDNLIKKMFEETHHHKRFPITFADKTTHNNFLDNLDHLSNLIFIMTSNSPPEWFNAIDESLIRKKRIDKIVHVSIDPCTYVDE